MGIFNKYICPGSLYSTIVEHKILPNGGNKKVYCYYSLYRTGRESYDLVREDDASIRDIEVYALQSTGIEARGFEDGTSFWKTLNGGEKPELAVIDVMLPLSE